MWHVSSFFFFFYLTRRNPIDINDLFCKGVPDQDRQQVQNIVTKL